MKKGFFILFLLISIALLIDYAALLMQQQSNSVIMPSVTESIEKYSNEKIVLNAPEIVIKAQKSNSHSHSSSQSSSHPTSTATNINSYASKKFDIMANNGTVLQVDFQTGNLSVAKDEFFNFTISVKCKSNCTNLVLTLDPVTAGKFTQQEIDNAEKELAKIEKSIEMNNASWRAELNDYFVEYVNKKQAEVKELPTSPSLKSEQVFEIKSAVTNNEEKITPYYFDWRNAYNENWVTPVKNQGLCGSCWAFAPVAVLESALNIFNRFPSLQLDLSEQELLSCAAGTCSSGDMSVAMNYVRDTGVVNETCFPYVASKVACSNKCQNSTQYHIKDRINLVDFPSSSIDKQTAINYLLKYGPAVKQMRVYNDFYAYSNGTYENTTSLSSGVHIVTVTGYNETGDYFIIKNSWGSGWGNMGGYAYIKSWLALGDPTLTDWWIFATGADKVNKGIIPMNSGTPFYTTTQNPYNCGNLSAGESCNVSFQVNATGFHLSNWTFFVILQSDEENLTTDNSTITIIGNYIPEIQSIECKSNNTWKNCADINANKTLTAVRINATDFDSSIDSAIIRLKENNVLLNENTSYFDGEFYIINTSNILQENKTYKIEADVYDSGYWINGFKQWMPEPASSCIENWTVQYGSCTINDTKLKYYADANSCNTTYNLPADNSTFASCDFCTPNWQNYNTTCSTGNLTEYWLDSSTCYQQTILPSDLLGQPANQTLSCTSQQCITVCSFTKCHRYCT